MSNCAVPRKKQADPSGSGRGPIAKKKQISLKTLADHLGLAPATVSLVINRSPVVDSIPQETKDRVFAAARKYKYRPNFLARSLRTQRSFVSGGIVAEVSDGYASMVMSGIEDHLLQEGYFYFVASHRHRVDLIDEYCQLFMGRSIDGLIAVDTPWHQKLEIPIVTVSGHNSVKGVTNIVLNHDLAATLALDHLMELGHRKIAFIKGQEFSSDTQVRWNAIVSTAERLGLRIAPRLTAQLEGNSSTPELGYKVTRKLISLREPFTALFAFNDISAMGAIRALRDAGVSVPHQVSVVGFDDIVSAAYHVPGLTTVRQPLRTMGKTAAETVLRNIFRRDASPPAKQVMVAPELVIRESTAPIHQPGKD
jgi:DNA-binding LacI/PurR family transcriptional regulator